MDRPDLNEIEENHNLNLIPAKRELLILINRSPLPYVPNQRYPWYQVVSNTKGYKMSKYKMRKLSPGFMKSLIDHDGALHPILERIQRDNTLLLCIRDNYINIYYRGGNLLRITGNKHSQKYKAFFDTNYNKNGFSINLPSSDIDSSNDAELWSKSFSTIKEVMDSYFEKNKKSEREFQQLVVRENTRSNISNQTEYFVTDIELSSHNARFDMSAVKISSKDRKILKNCKPVFFEMKYSIDALKGKSGMLKHIQDMDSLVSNKEIYDSIVENIEIQFKDMYELGLINYKKPQNKDIEDFSLNRDLKPEFIFILANCNPRSKNLLDIITDPKMQAFASNQHFDLKFFVSGYSGYALHSDCMFTLPEFQKIVSLFQ
ncbi:hypothetical protein [Desulfobulbus alkaliphilus]|uniref:hypothetical protein n=1 Tax=Desulfobulbus alkaliphilus TaxID=869814 RepID=UPI001963B458|nr:hypothetical protein [Desulfobulbus alkaliphilus]MBM9535975.1 hypothetical protein [Desulfobulbus alkaliphilus]